MDSFCSLSFSKYVNSDVGCLSGCKRLKREHFYCSLMPQRLKSCDNLPLKAFCPCSLLLLLPFTHLLPMLAMR